MDSTVKILNDLDTLRQSLKQREAELAVINSVQQGLVAEMDMQDIYDLVCNRIRKLFKGYRPPFIWPYRGLC